MFGKENLGDHYKPFIQQSAPVNQPENQEENMLSYSAMAAAIDDQEEIQTPSAPATPPPYPPSLYFPDPTLQPQIPMKFGSSGPAQVKHQFLVPIEIASKQSQPSFHVENGLRSNLGKTPLSKGVGNKEMVLARQHSQPVKMKGGQEKYLGQKIVDSVIKTEARPIISGVVLQESDILDEEDEGSSLSHFEPVGFDESVEQSKKVLDGKQQGDQNFVIKTSQVKQNKVQFQQVDKSNDSPIQWKYFRDSPKDNIQFQPQVTLKLPEQKPQKKKDLSQNNNQECQNIMVSRIIKNNCFSREKPDEEIREEPQVKEPQNKMKSTYDPKLESAFQKISNGGNFSQPDKRASNKGTKHKNPLSNFEQSEKSIAEETNYQQVIFQRLNQLLGLMQDIPQNSNQSIKKQLTLALAQRLKGKEDLPSRQKIEEFNRILPEELCEFSQIDKRQKELRKLPKQILPERQPRNFDRYKQKLGQVENRSKKDLAEIHRYKPTSNRQIAVNYRDYNHTSNNNKMFFKRPSYSVPNEDSDERTVSDEQFQHLERSIPSLPRSPKPHDDPETLTDLGIKGFQQFDIRADQYSSMDLTRLREGVLFELNQGPSLSWQYNGRVYFGDIKRQTKPDRFQMHGQGIQLLADSYIYRGEFYRNNRNGYGVLIDHNGDKYKGYWKNNKYDGRGKLITRNSVYDGQFLKGVKKGQGYQFYSNGDSYEGEYVDGKFNGKGIYVWKNKTVYEGQFKKNYMDGTGVWTSSNGDSYEGQYFKNMKHGKGIYRWKNGKIYQGRFEHGHRVDKHCSPKMTINIEKQITYDMTSYDESERYEVKMRQPHQNKKYTIHSLNSQMEERRSPRNGRFRPY